MHHHVLAQQTNGITEVHLDNLVLKGKGILEICLEQQKNLCMKGFIDSQIEQGKGYFPVVEGMIDHIRHELDGPLIDERRALLLDLEEYAGEQLRTVQTAEQAGTL